MAPFIDWRLRPGAWAVGAALLVTCPASAQLSTGYVDGGSNCFGRTGDRFCSVAKGPFRQISEGVKWVSAGGTLFISGGTYVEPILLNKPMQIQAYDGPVTIVGPSPLKPFDLVAHTADEDPLPPVDGNGLPLNPRWGGRRNTGSPPDPGQCPRESYPPGNFHFPNPGAASCSHQYSYYNSAAICGPHINWFGATYLGTLSWDGISC